MITSESVDFNPPAPHGAGPGTELDLGGQYKISIHPPHTGRDQIKEDLNAVYDISIHPPHTGRDLRQQEYLPADHDFNPPAPHGAGRGLIITQCGILIISIHPPHTGRDKLPSPQSCASVPISIHPPHTGRDHVSSSEAFFASRFQSTRPTRGGTLHLVERILDLAISIHPPHTGRDKCGHHGNNIGNISIHPPHTGRDLR